jgi:hypothetical protein
MAFTLSPFTQRRALATALGVIFIAVVFPTALAIIFATEDEVSYSAVAGLSTCSDFFIKNDAQLERCTSPFKIVLGNTGSNTQPLVSIRISPVPAELRMGQSVQDIVASARRSENPEISQHSIDNTRLFTIRNLAPNKLVAIDLVSRGIESHQQLQQLQVEVEATGSVIESNPRLTVLSRFARNLLGLF